jgi:hypothetical protein
MSHNGYSSAHGWEDHTSVTVGVHFFRGQELHTAERPGLSEEGKKLVFTVEAISRMAHRSAMNWRFT